MALVAWYRLNNLSDSGPHKLHLTQAQGSPITSSDRFNRPNQSYVFSQSPTQYLARNNTTGTMLDTSNSMSLTAWIRPTAYQPAAHYGLINMIMAKGDGARYNYGFQATDATTISFVKRLNAEGLSFTNFSLVPNMTNIWTHLVVTISGSAITLYRNGELFEQKTVGSIAPGTNDPFYIGNGMNTQPEPGFIGSIDDVRVYNHPLNTHEIQAIFKQGESGSTNFFG